MGPKKEFKSKKQLEEEAKKKKEEDDRRKKEEAEKKKIEEEIQRKIEEERLKKIEDERKAKEEKERLMEEEKNLISFNEKLDNTLQKSHNSLIEKEDWDKYSNCEENYISVRKEKDLTAFIYEFKERSDTTFISNFVLKEKNIGEEINYYDISENHCYNLYRLYLESKALYENNMKEYALYYLNLIKELEIYKMESLTKYFVENFEYEKKKIDEDSKKGKDLKEDMDKSVEYISKKGLARYSLWINTSDGKYRDTKTKFKNSSMHLIDIPKVLVQKSCVIRIFWMQSDIRELQIGEYCPYISVSGFFISDLIHHPEPAKEARTWSIRNMIEEKYKQSVTEIATNQKFKIKLDLPSNVYIKDLEGTEIQPARYFQKKKEELKEDENVEKSKKEEPGYWSFENFENVEFEKEKKSINFLYNDLGIFSLIIDRKYFFPYLSWYLRCIENNKSNDCIAILDLKTKRLDLIFEIGKDYVMLIKNEEKEFGHFVNKKMKFDQLIIEFRNCGILLNPLNEDLEAFGYKLKKPETEDRAIQDIVMASRAYAIKSHKYNLDFGEEIILAKFKTNMEHDLYFFDDEEKDWTDIAWYSNKVIKSKAEKKNDEFSILPLTETARPYYHLLVRDENQPDISNEIEDFLEHPDFLVNLRSFLRILRLTSFC